MSVASRMTPAAFHWNAGGWFGAQLGCTVWMLTFAATYVFADPILAAAGICGFVGLNLWGVLLWRSRHALSAYAGLQRFLLVASVIVAVLVTMVGLRGGSDAMTLMGLLATDSPYRIALILPTLMLLAFLRERHR